MYHEMKIAGLTRRLPLCPISDDTQIGAFIMFGDMELTTASASKLLTRAPEFDVIVTAESKGIPLACELSRLSGNKPYIVLRKEPKLYMRGVIKTTVDSITTDHIQILCMGEDDAHLLNGARVLAADDVISTGNSLKSMETLIKQVHGNIVGRICVLAEGDAAERDDIMYLERLPLFNADGSVK